MNIFHRARPALVCGLSGVWLTLVGCSGAGSSPAPRTESVREQQASLPVQPAGITPLTADANVVTYRNDISRSGAYLAETQLTPANVNTHTFGKLYERAVQGDVYAQPLYVRGVATAQGTKNLFFVATSTNDLYAFDADNASTDPYAGRVWHRSLNPWRPLVINREICAETVGSVGVTSTPVIDAASQTLYVTTRRSAGTVVASGGDLYQLHNGGLIWKYTGTPCSGNSCPGWQLYDNNPATIQIAASFSSPGLYQLHRDGKIWQSTGTACSGNSCPGWTLIDNNPATIRIGAAGLSGGAQLVQLHEDGSIWTRSGSTWVLDDNNPLTTQVVVSTTIGGTRLYQLHRDGSIWWQTGAGVPGWTMMDNNPATVQIAAAGQDLYQLHSDGSIWKSTGVACSGNSCPGWQMFDNNRATTAIAAAPVSSVVSGASSLYQLHTDGSIWKSQNTPCSGNNCPGWTMLDNNPAAAQIVTDNTNDILYQVHIDGSIWRATGVACSGKNCPGWQMLDNNWALNDGANYLHAINLADGTERRAPVKIQATDPANASIHFDSRCERQRPGLLLQNGILYLGFATFSCDQGAPDGSPYHGWVLAYRASDFAPMGVYDTSADGGGAGIWQSGGGLVGSPDGSIYFETGNDTNPPARLGDSFVKLQQSGSSLVAAGHYTVSNAATLRDGGTLSAAAAAMKWPIGDTDLGSGGPMLLPGGRRDGGGKQGRYYVLDTATMTMAQNATLDGDGFEGFQAFENTWHPTFTHRDYEMGELYGPNLHSAPIYWPGTSYVYQMSEKDFLKAFFYDPSTNVLSSTASVTATGSWARARDGMPGGFTSLSANGNSNGIVWLSLPQADGQWTKVAGTLAAFDATTLQQIWADESAVSFAKFVPPMIADGRVYRATFTSDVHHGIPGKVVVYGLHPFTAVATPATSASEDGERAIDAAYRAHGGALGPLGQAQGETQPLEDGGQLREFRSTPRRLAEVVVHPMEGNAALPAPARGGRLSLDSAIYWSQKTGAHVVQGGILQLWRQLGAEKSALGYPVSDEVNAADATARVSHFQHGDIVWSAERGAVVQLAPHKGRAPSRAPARAARR
jgi:hypothetical protein